MLSPVEGPGLGLAEGAAGNQGLQGGWVVDEAGDIDFDKSVYRNLPAMRQAGAGWVRINFRLGACYADWTTSGCNRKAALQPYDEVIDRARSLNLQVLGLLSNESWHGQQADWTANNAEVAGGSGDNAYIQAFAGAAGVLAEHFAGRVAQWEVWNEPNAWTSSDGAGRYSGGTFIYPSNLAWLLKRSYAAIKVSEPSAVVIAGGLFGHDLGGASVTIMERGQLRRTIKRGDFAPARSPARPGTSTCSSAVPSGADYLCATYAVGIAEAGWTPGAYPFDHVGQHLYIDQSGTTTAKKLGSYLKDIRNAYVFYEGTGTAKRTHMTEFGWPTSSVSERTQAANLKTAYDTFRKTTYVGRAYWFSIQDVPAAALYFGLLRDNGSQKPSFAAYQTAAAY